MHTLNKKPVIIESSMRDQRGTGARFAYCKKSGGLGSM